MNMIDFLKKCANNRRLSQKDRETAKTLLADLGVNPTTKNAKKTHRAVMSGGSKIGQMAVTIRNHCGYKGGKLLPSEAMEAARLLDDCKRIQAIKLIRERTGLGLVDAKRVTDVALPPVPEYLR